MQYLHIINVLTFLSIIFFNSCNDNKGDTSAPEVSVTFPENGAVVNEIVTISVNAIDNEEIDFVQFFVNDSLDSALVSAEPYLFNWNTNILDDGNYTIAVIAQDASKNTSDTLKITLTVDNSLSSPKAVEIMIYHIASICCPFVLINPPKMTLMIILFSHQAQLKVLKKLKLVKL